MMKTPVMEMTKHKLGLKVWSANLFYLKPARDFYNRGVFDYVELYVVPGTKDSCLQQWREERFPFFLHAPHSYHGFNLSLKEFEGENRIFLEEVESFRSALNSRQIIFHPGTDGLLQETIRQINFFKREFSDLFKSAVIENKPRIGLGGEMCVGASPEEIKEILQETGLGFCLDIGHAICYAAWKGIRYEGILDQFITMCPQIYHLSDGDINSKTDSHLNYGKGNFDFEFIIFRIPSNAYVSIETGKKKELNLYDFQEDVTYFKDIYRKIRAQRSQ